MDAAPGPSYRKARCASTCAIALTYDSQFSPGLFPGVGEALHGVGDFAIEHMRIARGGLDAGVIECPLHQLQVAGRAQQLGAEVVPEIRTSGWNNAPPSLLLPSPQDPCLAFSNFGVEGTQALPESLSAVVFGPVQPP
jgi:hypothetical protein